MSRAWGNIADLRMAAETLADAKKARISADNRVKRGRTVGCQLEAAEILDPAKFLEEQYKGVLLSQYQATVPEHIRKWAECIPGLASGPLFARMLGVIGNPRIATPYRREKEDGKVILVADGKPYERTVRQLWQYCGCGDPRTIPTRSILGESPTQEQLLRGGQRTTMLPLLYTFSSYLVLQHTRSEAVADSKYYLTYVGAKADCELLGRVHEFECRNRKRPPMGPNGCGTSLHPEWGAPGSPWRPGHINAHAHRLVWKAFLKDLWIISGE